MLSSKRTVPRGSRNADPDGLYNLAELRGSAIDRWALYVFRCAVYYAGYAEHDTDRETTENP